MRPDPCQSSKRKAVEPVSSPSGTSIQDGGIGAMGSAGLQLTPGVSENRALLLLAVGVPAERKRNSAATCGRLPAAFCRACRPASVGAPLRVKPEPSCRSVHRCTDPKNQVLSLPLKYGRRTGPPK